MVNVTVPVVEVEATVSESKEVSVVVSTTEIESNLNIGYPLGVRGPKGDQGDPGQNGQDGADGQDGAPGADGQDGEGVPTGGSAGQHLVKHSGTDFDTEWKAPGIEWTVVWTNPSPSAAFEPQQVTVDMSSYDWIYVAAKASASSSSNTCGCVLPVRGLPDIIRGGNIVLTSSTGAYFRSLRVSATGYSIIFGEAYAGDTIANTVLIPVTIYGGKTK